MWSLGVFGGICGLFSRGWVDWGAVWEVSVWSDLGFGLSWYLPRLGEVTVIWGCGGGVGVWCLGCFGGLRVL
jgi:hypothetical protein